MLFYTHKGFIKVAHVQDHLSEAVHPSRDNFMTSCAWFPSNCPPCGSHLLEVHLQLRWRTPSNFILKSLAPPSHHIRPVASVPSLGAAAEFVLRLDGGARGQQCLDHLQVAFKSRQVQRPLASVWRAPLEMATGRANSHELLWRISEDFVEKWEFGHVWSTISNWDMYHCLSKSGSTDWEVTPLPCHTLQTRSKIHSNTLQSKQEIIRIQLHASAMIID